MVEVHSPHVLLVVRWRSTVAHMSTPAHNEQSAAQSHGVLGP